MSRCLSHRLLSALGVCGLLAMPLALARPAHAAMSDNFATDPIAGGRATVVGDAARFSYDAAAHAVVAQYDSSLPTAELVFPLGTTLTQNQSFTFTTTFTIRSITNFDHAGASDPQNTLGNAELSFGLLNSVTTGTNRTDGFSGDAYDLATVDYFPTHNSFGTPGLSPTVVESAAAGASYYEKIDFAPAANSSLPTFLNAGVPITATVSYDAGTHVISATFNASQLLADGSGSNTFTSSQNLDLTSLAYDSQGFSGFNLDSFGLLLWDDSSAITAGYDAPVSATIAYSGFSVAVPEPASLALLAAGSLLLVRRR